MSNLSIIIPFFNEEKYLSRSIERVLNTNFFEEIILVDDFSSDNSSKIAEGYSSKFSNISLIKSKSQGGKGAAVKLGINEATSSYVVVHDADLEYFPDDIVEMTKYINSKNSIILGSRFIAGKSRKNIYKRTIMANNLLSKFFSILYSYKVTDIATCYKIMSTEILKNIELNEKGFAFEVELLSKYFSYEKRVIEVPIRYEGRTYDEGKKIKFKDGIEFVYKIVKYRFA